MCRRSSTATSPIGRIRSTRGGCLFHRLRPLPRLVLYEGQCKVKDLAQLEELAKIADFLQCKSLFNAVDETLANEFVDESNCVALKEFGDRYALTLLRQEAISTVRRFFGRLSRGDSLLSMSIGTLLLDYLSDERTRASEEDLFLFCERWLAHPNNDKKQASALLSTLSFQRMYPSFVVDVVLKSSLVKENNRLATHIATCLAGAVWSSPAMTLHLERGCLGQCAWTSPCEHGRVDLRLGTVIISSAYAAVDRVMRRGDGKFKFVFRMESVSITCASPVIGVFSADLSEQVPDTEFCLPAAQYENNATLIMVVDMDVGLLSFHMHDSQGYGVIDFVQDRAIDRPVRVGALNYSTEAAKIVLLGCYLVT